MLRFLNRPKILTGLCRYSRQKSTFRVNEEVAEAIKAKQPVVALESTIITHGLPYPANVDMAKEVESIVRASKCVPATIGFLEGSGVVGLTSTEIEHLAAYKTPEKISRRDIPIVASRGITGGTTIASTMILAHKAGIRVFATGGLGGVHRGVADTWDISADLDELARTPVAVVCSGPKSILDVPKTIEYLETKGVPVVTYGSGGVPGFFTMDSGVPSPFNFNSPEEAAAIIDSQTKYDLQNGSVFCIPCPEELALPKQLVSDAIERALVSAQQSGISGKQITPYLLKEVWKATGGNSIKTNIEFVKNNAKMASDIARALSAASIPPSIQMPILLTPQSASTPLQTSDHTSQTRDIVAVGSLCQDMTCTLDTDNVSVTSHPGRISTDIGGTAHNVALAAAYNGASTRLVSCIGEKERESLLDALSPALDATGVLVQQNQRTARYVCINDSKGDLVVACSDMDNISKLDAKHVTQEIERADPAVVVFDANLGKSTTEALLSAAKAQGRLVIFEPTSVPKAARIADQPHLKVFPNASIDIATPNSLELMGMFEEFSFKDLFDIDNWFPIIDALPITDPLSQMKLDVFMRSHPALEQIIQSGMLQATVHLLPYIPNMFVTLGGEGILSFQLIEGLRDRTAGIKGGVNSVYILSKTGEFGLLIQHFPIPSVVPKELIKSVNGIGDTFCGTIAAQLAKSPVWLRDDGLLKRAVIDRAQTAASLSLQTYETVNSDITDLKHVDVEEFLSH